MNKKVIIFYIFFTFICFLSFDYELSASESVEVFKTKEENSPFRYVDEDGNVKTMPLYSFTDSNGQEYICLQSGLDGADYDGTGYFKDEDFSVSDCSNNWTRDCGLAYILSEANNLGLSYRALETALRLYNVYYADPSNSIYGEDGSYDDVSGLTDRESIYLDTARAVKDQGYDGTNPNGSNVLYISSDYTGEDANAIKDAIDLFNKTPAVSFEDSETANTSSAGNVLAYGGIMNTDWLTNRNKRNSLLNELAYKYGNYLEDDSTYLAMGDEISSEVANATIGWTPSVSITNTSRNESTGQFTFTLQTNFNSSTSIDIPSQVSGYPTTVSKNCSSTGCTIYVTITPPDNNECVTLDFDISFNDSRYSMGSVEKLRFSDRQDLMTFTSTPGGGSYPISGEWCDESGDDCCNDMRIQDNIPMHCDSSSEGSVEDPEMCSIIKSCDSGKESSYDFTETAGLNEKYCSLYCREKIEFTFMDRTEVIAGRQFKYDVSSRVTTTQMLSTVILGTRECMSPEIKYEQWEKDYLEADKAVLNAWNNLKFWETLYNHIGEYVQKWPIVSCSDSECCSGSYDEDGNCVPGMSSHSCMRYYEKWYWGTNGSGPFPYNKSDINGNESSSRATHESGSASCTADACAKTCDYNITLPTDSVIRSSYSAAVNSYKKALETREKLLMDIQNCNLLSYSNFTYTPQTYDVGKAGSYRYSFGEADTAYYKVVSDYDFHSIVDITYEDQYSPLINIQEDNPIQVNTTNSYCKDCDYDSYCGGCGNEPQLGSMSTKNDLRRIVCSGQETGAQCEVINTVVPDNNAAMVTTSKEQHFWQSATFYTQLYTGTVSTSTNGQGWWIGLDDYIYPIELNKENGSYGVYVDISNIGAASRPQNIKISDKEFECAFDVINETTMYECDPEDSNCFIECDPEIGDVCEDYGEGKTGLGMVVRSVDLTNLFPNNRTVGMNWRNSEKIIDAIQDVGDSIWTDATPRAARYVIELSPSNIKNIREYNDERDYIDYSLTCDSSLNCTSDFLDVITTNNYAYNSLVDGRNVLTDTHKNFYKYTRSVNQ